MFDKDELMNMETILQVIHSLRLFSDARTQVPDDFSKQPCKISGLTVLGCIVSMIFACRPFCHAVFLD
jgi:hypothetical protein